MGKGRQLFTIYLIFLHDYNQYFELLSSYFPVCYLSFACTHKKAENWWMKLNVTCFVAVIHANVEK